MPSSTTDFTHSHWIENFRARWIYCTRWLPMWHDTAWRQTPWVIAAFKVFSITTITAAATISPIRTTLIIGVNERKFSKTQKYEIAQGKARETRDIVVSATLIKKKVGKMQTRKNISASERTRQFSTRITCESNKMPRNWAKIHAVLNWSKDNTFLRWEQQPQECVYVISSCYCCCWFFVLDSSFFFGSAWFSSYLKLNRNVVQII